jgi:alkyl sulfatase BDS1-like metallo-beta-lactamase superfamily hydrolase
LTRDTLNAIVLRRATISDAIQSGQIKAIGEAGRAGELFSLLDVFNPYFEIVEPRKYSN